MGFDCIIGSLSFILLSEVAGVPHLLTCHEQTQAKVCIVCFFGVPFSSKSSNYSELIDIHCSLATVNLSLYTIRMHDIYFLVLWDHWVHTESFYFPTIMQID